MSDAREALGTALMVLGVALLVLTALVDLPGLRRQQGPAPAVAAACYVASFAALLGGAWLSSSAP